MIHKNCKIKKVINLVGLGGTDVTGKIKQAIFGLLEMSENGLLYFTSYTC